MKRTAYFLAGTLLYFSWYHFVVGWRPEHTAMYVLLVALYFSHPQTRRFLFAFAAFLIYWIVYDAMRIVPNYTVNPVHIIEPYSLEKAWFGLNAAGGARITLNEYFAAHGTPVLDVVTGLFYLGWVPIPMMFAFWLFLYQKRLFIRFSYGFLFTNLLGFAIYYLYPAAPPWYVEWHGFSVQNGTPGNAAGLLNFDAFFGIHLFAGMYEKNANVFAAIPSLHSAYPVLCLLYGRHLRRPWLNVLFAVFVAGIWFAAVYTRHHYVIDVLAGGLVAFAGYLSFEYLATQTRLKGGLDALLRYI